MARKPVKANPNAGTPVGKPQSAYNKDRPGDEWFTEEQNVMDNRKTEQVPKGAKTDYSGRAREEQLDDQSKRATKGVAGAMDSYKKGGIVKKTGPAYVHKGERVIPKKSPKKHEVKKERGKR